VPTRTWLTTPPDQAPRDEQGPEGEHYVPGPDLPREPRVPGRHQTRILVLSAVLLVAAIIATVVVVGEQALSEDPSVPGTTDPDQPEQLELPES
jgi:hypothetical protein